MNVRKILVTTDLSQYSQAALEAAAAIAVQFASRLYLLHVVDVPPAVAAPRELDAEARAAHQRAEDQGKRKLEEFLAHNADPAVHTTPVLRVGPPVDEILRFAEQEGVDVIVMATHGWTGLKHILLGSVAERVIRHSSIPVLTVKPYPLRENFLKDEDIESDLHLR